MENAIFALETPKKHMTTARQINVSTSSQSSVYIGHPRGMDVTVSIG